MKKSPKVFIVILNYNGGSFLRDCLESLFKIDYDNFEVVVVDNNSEDGSLELAKKEFSRPKYFVNDSNLGFAAANNIGIRYALNNEADYVLLLNNDTLVEKNFLGILVDVASKDREIGLLSPFIYQDRGPEVWFSSAKIDWLRMKTLHKKEKQLKSKSYQSELISGCAMFMPVKLVEKIGFLDSDFFLYWEDADFSYRAKKAGFKRVVVPTSKIYHFEQSNKVSEKKAYYLVLSGLLFFKKNTPTLLKPWIYLYVKLRRLKNFIDLNILKDKNVIKCAVYKAYKDFKNDK